MWGGIIGDIAGSQYEGAIHNPIDTPLFEAGCQFTDDTICICAVAEHLLTRQDLPLLFSKWVKRYPTLGYGSRFKAWALSPLLSTDSNGNGAAMRIGPLIAAVDNEVTLLEEAKRISELSHNSLEAIEAAQAVALAGWQAKQGIAPSDIAQEVERLFGYAVTNPLFDYYAEAKFTDRAQDSVPVAIACALQSESYEDAIHNAISIGGDSDTLAAIAGTIAEYIHGVPLSLVREASLFLTPDITGVLYSFYQYYQPNTLR